MNILLEKDFVGLIGKGNFFICLSKFLVGKIDFRGPVSTFEVNPKECLGYKRQKVVLTPLSNGSYRTDLVKFKAKNVWSFPIFATFLVFVDSFNQEKMIYVRDLYFGRQFANGDILTLDMVLKHA